MNRLSIGLEYYWGRRSVLSGRIEKKGADLFTSLMRQLNKSIPLFDRIKKKVSSDPACFPLIYLLVVSDIPAQQSCSIEPKWGN